jgi:ABC-type nitrate/sulfonate/bicarbonate transport system substrate-binding protein
MEVQKTHLGNFIPAMALLALAFSPVLLGFSTAMGATLRIGVPSPSVSYLPLIVAWKMGFIAQEGVQAEFIVMKPSIIPAAMVNGEIQFTTATGTAVGAALRGFPFKTVIFFSSKLMDSLITRPEIRTFADLRGKIVGIDTPGATTDVITRLLLEKNRLDPSRDLKVLATGHEEIRLEQLKLGQIDAAMLGPQGVVVAKRAGLRVLADVADQVELPFVGGATYDQMIERRRDELKRFLRAGIRGIRYTLDPANRSRISNLLREWLNLDSETAEYTYEMVKKVAAPDGMLTRAEMQTLLNERKRQTKVTADVPLDKIYNFSLVEEINRELSQAK